MYVVCTAQFCGDTIAGLCLLSSAVMRLAHAEREHLALDALLQRRCLYVMTYVAPSLLFMYGTVLWRTIAGLCLIV